MIRKAKKQGQRRRTPTAKAAGVQRREIEGEGLGGSARRLTINGDADPMFRRLAIFFGPASL
jgi:hypothetical protein